MQLNAGKLGVQLRPLGKRFLHAVLAKDTLARAEHGPYLPGSEGFGDADKRNLVGVAPGAAGGAGYALADSREAAKRRLRRLRCVWQWSLGLVPMLPRRGSLALGQKCSRRKDLVPSWPRSYKPRITGFAGVM
jgi:hypothetical protein